MRVGLVHVDRFITGQLQNELRPVVTHLERSDGAHSATGLT